MLPTREQFLFFLLGVASLSRFSVADGAESARGLQTRAFDCGSVPLLLVLLADHATIYLPQAGMTLTRVPHNDHTSAHRTDVSLQGAETFADEHSTLTIQADHATLRVARRRYPRCRENVLRGFWQAAQLRDASFRAAAPDLSWTLDLIELRETQVLRFATTDGSGTLWFREVHTEPGAAPEPQSIAAANAAHRITAHIARNACAMPTLGTRFSYRVVIDVDGHQRIGCGGRVP